MANNKDRIIKLLRKAGYEPVDATPMLDNPEPGDWVVHFDYIRDGGGIIRTDSITPKTLVADLWWLV